MVVLQPKTGQRAVIVSRIRSQRPTPARTTRRSLIQIEARMFDWDGKLRRGRAAGHQCNGPSLSKAAATSPYQQSDNRHRPAGTGRRIRVESAFRRRNAPHSRVSSIGSGEESLAHDFPAQHSGYPEGDGIAHALRGWTSPKQAGGGIRATSTPSSVRATMSPRVQPFESALL